MAFAAAIVVGAGCDGSAPYLRTRLWTPSCGGWLTGTERSRCVADLALVLLTVGLFAVLALIVRGTEKL